jgi:hypothetical protein
MIGTRCFDEIERYRYCTY